RFRTLDFTRVGMFRGRAQARAAAGADRGARAVLPARPGGPARGRGRGRAVP
ncbi:unnamed protein product, partial [Heterosigma akashiwo]